MNSQSKKANVIIAKYNRTEESLETNLVDILADLMHWCNEYDISFHDAITIATRHYVKEVEEEEFENKQLTEEQ